MTIIKIIGWFGSHVCKVCGTVAPYGVCPTCNNLNIKK
jgi:rubrerythrin